jgi:hypothetical protein
MRRRLDEVTGAPRHRERERPATLQPIDAFAWAAPGYSEANEGGDRMLLLIVLALLAALFFGLGFTIKWLFILAVIAALLWVIALFTGGLGGRSRGSWW